MMCAGTKIITYAWMCREMKRQGATQQAILEKAAVGSAEELECELRKTTHEKGVKELMRNFRKKPKFEPVSVQETTEDVYEDVLDTEVEVAIQNTTSDEVESLKNALQANIEELAELEMSRNSVTDEVQDLNDQLNCFLQQAEDLEAKIKSLTEQIQSVILRKQECEAERRTVQEQIEAARFEVELKKEKIRNLETCKISFVESLVSNVDGVNYAIAEEFISKKMMELVTTDFARLQKLELSRVHELARVMCIIEEVEQQQKKNVVSVFCKHDADIAKMVAEYGRKVEMID